jgi:hypothetical protein
MSSLWLEEARAGITATWTQQRPNLPFLSKMKTVSRFYRDFCKKKALSLRAEESTARSNFEAASLQLNNSPNDLLLQQQHSLARQSLQTIETRKLEGKRLRSRIRWKFQGDMIFAEFFKAVWEKSTSTAFTGLKDPAHNLVTDSREIRCLTSAFFRSLYAGEAATPEH